MFSVAASTVRERIVQNLQCFIRTFIFQFFCTEHTVHDFCSQSIITDVRGLCGMRQWIFFRRGVHPRFP